MTRLTVSIISIALIIFIAIFSLLIARSMINDTIKEIEEINFDENFFERCLLVENNWQKRIKFIKCFMNNSYLVEANKAVLSVKYSADESEFSENCKKAKEELLVVLENETINFSNLLFTKIVAFHF